MCEPTTLMVAMGALAGTQAIASAQAQRSAAKSQIEAASEALASENAAEQETRLQTTRSGMSEQFAAALSNLIQGGRASAAVADRGLEGSTPLRQVSQQFMNASLEQANISTGLENQARSSVMRQFNARRTARIRYRNARRGTDSRAGQGLKFVLGTGVGALEGYTMGKSLKR